jgi:FHS family glucose/mannose:H+ symporter-like MFS transporter
MYFLLTGASICGIGLLLSGSVVSIAVWAAGCGALLGPVFPATLASLLAQRPTARQCGVALAACGAGASAMPLLLSVISQRTSSLRFALLLPCMCLLLMLAFVWKLPRAEEEPRLPA